jgi:cardiolipin synthase A/B
VGSINFDIRSIRLNDEASLNIYNNDFATQMTAVFETDLLAAEPYPLRVWGPFPAPKIC